MTAAQSDDDGPWYIRWHGLAGVWCSEAMTLRQCEVIFEEFQRFRRFDGPVPIEIGRERLEKKV